MRYDIIKETYNRYGYNHFTPISMNSEFILHIFIPKRSIPQKNVSTKSIRQKSIQAISILLKNEGYGAFRTENSETCM